MCSRAGARGRGREGGRRTHRGSSYLSGDRRGSTICRWPHANVAGSPRATPRAWGSRSSIGSSGFLLRQVRTFCLRNREKHPGRRCQTAAKRAAVINAFDGERGGKVAIYPLVHPRGATRPTTTPQARSAVTMPISPPTIERRPATRLPPRPPLRTTTPKHCPSVCTVRCPAMFSVVATIIGDRQNLRAGPGVEAPSPDHPESMNDPPQDLTMTVAGFGATAGRPFELGCRALTGDATFPGCLRTIRARQGSY